MTQAAERHAILRSGPLVLDRRQRRLTRAGQAVPISGLPARILELLMAANGELVTRAELKQALWPYATRIDTERRLNTGVRALREALGDTAMTPRYVATVRGLGYRWVGGAEPPALGEHHSDEPRDDTAEPHAHHSERDPCLIHAPMMDRPLIRGQPRHRDATGTS